MTSRDPARGSAQSPLSNGELNSILENLTYARAEGTDRPEVTSWVWPG